jgi:hypothetical protein
MNLRSAAFGAATALLVLCPCAVYADPIGFGYNFMTPTSVTGDGGNLGVVSFSTTDPGHASGTATLTAASLTAVTSAANSNPDTFNGETYSLLLQLTDTSSGKSGSLNFTGKLFGSLTATAASITTSFSPATKQLVLGNDLYTVSVGPLVPPTTANPTVVGTLFATVAAQPETVNHQGGGQVAESAPEPGSLVLAVVSVLGVVISRRPTRFAKPIN